MKINLIHKKLSKSLLLASAISVLSFTSIHATDFIVPDWSSDNFSNRTESNGTIRLENGAEIYFNDSALGNNAGGRFSVWMDAAARLELTRTTLYSDKIDSNGSYTTLFVMNNAVCFVDNVVSNVHELRMNGNSILKARIYRGEDSFIEMSDFSHIEARLDINYLVMHNATTSWTSIGSSKLEYLYSYGNSSIELVMTSVGDALNIGRIYSYGDALSININFTDDLIEEAIANTGGTFGFHMDNVIVTSLISGDVEYTVRDSNGTYKWDVIDLGGGNFDITNFTLIPEPTTYAAIFGVLAFGLAIYRRRK